MGRQMLYDPGPSQKRCFAYCGDELCNCESSPRYRKDFATQHHEPIYWAKMALEMIRDGQGDPKKVATQALDLISK